VRSVISPPTRVPAGHASIGLSLSGGKTVLVRALAASPVRLLTPRNHGCGAWVYLATLGGGLVDGDGLTVQIDAPEGTTAAVGTQASTKVYRSIAGCSQEVDMRVADGAALALIPDPVVCFAGARYSQALSAWLSPGASLLVLDGYTCGRAARGERWQFLSFRSRTTVHRGGVRTFVDATRLDGRHGSIAERMGRYDVVLSLVAIGPRFGPVRQAMLSARSSSSDAIAAVSPLGVDAALMRVAGDCFEAASRLLQSSFAALAVILGDDPFARKW
jgi:urease accessory protein